MSEHLAIIQPDDRKRFPIGRFITREPNAGWKVFVENYGKTIRLEAVPL